MPGSILLDDWKQSIQDQLGSYANGLTSAAQQAVAPVALIPTPQTPDPNAILAELQQHAQDALAASQQQAQQIEQPALQVLGQGAQVAGGAVTQLGGAAQQAKDQIAQQLVQHAQDAADTRQQLQDHVATVLGGTDVNAPAGVQSLAVPKPAPVLGGTQQDQNTPTLGATTGAVGGDVSGLPSADTTVAPSRVGQGQSAFIQSLQPLAAKVAARTGIDPNVMIAIAANETGWGQSSNAKDMNNLFSLQGDGSNGSRWASYTSPEQSFQAFSDLIQNAPRYAQAWADRADPAKFVGDLRNAGYVVDEPGYPAQGWVDQVNSINTNLPPVTGTTGTSTTQGVNQPIPQTASDWLDLAKQQLGKPYIWGSAGGRSDFSPTAAGFDCSGFVSYVYKDALGINLPAQTESAYAATKPIGGDQALPGDVVLYNMDNPDPHIQHIAIYIGSGQVIQAGGGVDKNVNIAPIGQAGNYEFRRAAGAETAIGNAAATQHVATQLGSTAAEQNAPLTMGANQPAKAPLAVSDQAPTPIQSAQDVLGQAGQAVGGAASALGTAAQGALGTAQEINRIQPGTEAIKAVTPILGQAQQSAQTALGGAAGAVDQVASDLGQAAQGVVSGAAQTAGGAAQAATPVLGGAASAVGTTARGTADVLGATASGVGAGAQQAANDLGTAARGAADTTGQTLGGAAASVDQVRQQVQDTINSLPANATVAQARQTIGDTLDALGPRALDIAGDLPLPMGGTVSDLTNVGRGAQAGLQTIEEQRQAEIDRPDPFQQFQDNVDAARRGDWGAFATGTLALAQRPFEPVMGGSSADLAPSVSSALTAGGIDPNAARVIGQVANIVGPMALERAIPEVVSAASRGADAAATAGLEAIDRLAPPEIASATTRRASESADDYLARLSDEATVQRPATTPPTTVPEAAAPAAATPDVGTEMQRNFLRDHRIVPNSDPRPQTTSVGLPNVKGIDQANLAEEVGQGVDTLYHETSVPNARALLDRIEQGPRTLSQVYTADNRDLALGQGGRGVLLEFDPTRVNGSANANPVKQAGAAVGAGTEYTVDRSLPGAVKAIVVRNQRQADQLAANARVAARFDFANATPAEGGGLRIPYRVRTAPPVAVPPVAAEPTGFRAPETAAPAEETPQAAAFRAPETSTEGEALSPLAQQFADHFGSPAAAVREFDTAVAEGRASPTFAERTAIDELRTATPPSAAAEAFTGARAAPNETVTATSPTARVTARIGEPPLPPRESPVTTAGTPPSGGSGGSSPELDKLNAMYDGKNPAPAASIPDRIQQVGDSLTRMFTDRQVDINRAQERYAANLGRPLRGDEMAAELQRLASDPVAQVKVDEGLKPAIQSVGSDYPALRNYVTLRSNIEVADNLASRTGNAEAGADRLFSGGLNRDESVKALQDLEQQLGPARFARVQAAADQVTAFNNSLRQRLVQAGVLDEGTAAQLEAQYPNWAKTRILDYMADPAGGQGAGTKLGLSDRGLREYTLKGTDQAREDPIASTVAYAHQVERMAMKNEAFQAFLKIDQAGENPMLHEVPQSYTPKSNETTMIGFIDGQKQKYVTDNKALGAAINGASVLSTPEWTSAWQKIFRSIATSRNPLFLAGNAALDIPTYVLRSSVREGGPQALPRILGELASGYADAFKGLLQGEFRGEGSSEFLKGGGGQSGYFTGGEGQTKRAIAEMQRKNVFQIDGWQDLGRLTKDLLTLHPVEALGERIEMGPRVAAMRLAQRRGANPTQAIIDGRTVTVDFSQGGTVTKYLNNFIPFFNVGFQGPAQIARSFRENPRAFVATVGTLIGIPSAAAEVWNRSDPQRAKDYADVPQYVKDQGIVVMLPGEAPVDQQGNRKPMYALIKLREWMPFATIAREATDRALGDDSRSWQEMASSTLSGVSPIQAQNVAQAGTEPLGGIPILPAAAQLAMNTDFFRGRTIVTQRADQNASAAAKTLTPAIQAIVDRAGINAEIRPSAIDFLIRNQGAGVGGAALGASDLAAGQPSDTAGATGLPGVGGLIGRFAGNQTGNELQQARDNSLSAESRQALRNNGITTTPGPVSSSVNQIPLKLDEETKYQQLANQYIDQAIRRTTASPDFARMTQVGKQSMMDQAIQAARQKAGIEVLNTIPAAEKSRRLKTKSTAPVAA